jgi:hypothetical protein
VIAVKIDATTNSLSHMRRLYSLQLFFPDKSVCAVQEIPGGVDVSEMSEHDAVVRADCLLKESYDRLPHLEHINAVLLFLVPFAHNC